MAKRLSFTDAMQGYAPVLVPLLVADTIAAAWLLWDTQASFSVVVGAFIIAVPALWLMTVGVCALFAAKEMWLSRRPSEGRDS